MDQRTGRGENGLDALGDSQGDNGGQRGATLVEYAILVALLVVTSIVAIDFITAESSEYLTDTASAVGEPRERIVDIETDLPDPPAWVP